MRSLFGGRLRLPVLIAIVGGLALAGIVYASIPDSNAVIHGCYAKNNGGLRVIDTGAGQSCNTNKETPLSWNQSGPPGAPGPSDAYTVEGSGQVPDDGTHFTVASMSLPHGSFVVSATLILTGANTPLGTFIRCVTLQDGLPILDGTGAMNIDPTRTVMMPILGRAIIRDATSATLTLACWASGGSVSTTGFAVATKIGTIHDCPGGC
jgi:hypothetical protein